MNPISKDSTFSSWDDVEEAVDRYNQRYGYSFRQKMDAPNRQRVEGQKITERVYVCPERYRKGRRKQRCRARMYFEWNNKEDKIILMSQNQKHSHVLDTKGRSSQNVSVHHQHQDVDEQDASDGHQSHNASTTGSDESSSESNLNGETTPKPLSTSSVDQQITVTGEDSQNIGDEVIKSQIEGAAGTSPNRTGTQHSRNENTEGQHSRNGNTESQQSRNENTEVHQNKNENTEEQQSKNENTEAQQIINENTEEQQNKNEKTEGHQIKNENMEGQQSRNKNTEGQQSRNENTETQQNNKENAATQENNNANAEAQKNNKENAETHQNKKDNAETHQNKKENGETQENNKDNAEVRENNEENRETQQNDKEKVEIQHSTKEKGKTQQNSEETGETQQSNAEKGETQQKDKEKGETQRNDKEKGDKQQNNKENGETQESDKEKGETQQNDEENGETEQNDKEKEETQQNNKENEETQQNNKEYEETQQNDEEKGETQRNVTENGEPQQNNKEKGGTQQSDEEKGETQQKDKGNEETQQNNKENEETQHKNEEKGETKRKDKENGETQQKDKEEGETQQNDKQKGETQQNDKEKEETQQNNKEKREKQQNDEENGETQQKDKEKGETQQNNTENGETQQKDKEKEETQQNEKQKGETQQKDKEEGETQQNDKQKGETHQNDKEKEETQQNDKEKGETQQNDKQKEETQQKDKESEETQQNNKENGATQQKDKEKGETQQKDKEKGETQQNDKQKGETHQNDKEKEETQQNDKQKGETQQNDKEKEETQQNNKEKREKQQNDEENGETQQKDKEKGETQQKDKEKGETQQNNTENGETQQKDKEEGETHQNDKEKEETQQNEKQKGETQQKDKEEGETQQNDEENEETQQNNTEYEETQQNDEEKGETQQKDEENEETQQNNKEYAETQQNDEEKGETQQNVTENGEPQQNNKEKGETQQNNAERGDKQQKDKEREETQQNNKENGATQQKDKEKGETQQNDKENGETKQNDEEKGETQQNNAERGDKQQNDKEKGETQQNNAENGETQQKDQDKGEIQQNDKENGKTEQKDKERGETRQNNTENGETQKKDIEKGETQQKDKDNGETEQNDKENGEIEQNDKQKGETQQNNEKNGAAQQNDKESRETQQKDKEKGEAQQKDKEKGKTRQNDEEKGKTQQNDEEKGKTQQNDEENEETQQNNTEYEETQQNDEEKGETQQKDEENEETQQNNKEYAETQQNDEEKGETQQNVTENGEPQQNNKEKGETQQSDEEKGETQQKDKENEETQQNNKENEETQHNDEEKGETQQNDIENRETQQNNKEKGETQEKSKETSETQRNVKGSVGKQQKEHCVVGKHPATNESKQMEKDSKQIHDLEDLQQNNLPDDSPMRQSKRKLINDFNQSGSFAAKDDILDSTPNSFHPSHIKTSCSLTHDQGYHSPNQSSFPQNLSAIGFMSSTPDSKSSPSTTNGISPIHQHDHGTGMSHGNIASNNPHNQQQDVTDKARRQNKSPNSEMKGDIFGINEVSFMVEEILKEVKSVSRDQKSLMKMQETMESVNSKVIKLDDSMQAVQTIIQHVESFQTQRMNETGFAGKTSSTQEIIESTGPSLLQVNEALDEHPKTEKQKTEMNGGPCVENQNENYDLTPGNIVLKVSSTDTLKEGNDLKDNGVKTSTQQKMADDEFVAQSQPMSECPRGKDEQNCFTKPSHHVTCSLDPEAMGDNSVGRNAFPQHNGQTHNFRNQHSDNCATEMGDVDKKVWTHPEDSKVLHNSDPYLKQDTDFGNDVEIAIEGLCDASFQAKGTINSVTSPDARHNAENNIKATRANPTQENRVCPNNDTLEVNTETPTTPHPRADSQLDNQITQPSRNPFSLPGLEIHKPAHSQPILVCLTDISNTSFEDTQHLVSERCLLTENTEDSPDVKLSGTNNAVNIPPQTYDCLPRDLNVDVEKIPISVLQLQNLEALILYMNDLKTHLPPEVTINKLLELSHALKIMLQDYRNGDKTNEHVVTRETGSQRPTTDDCHGEPNCVENKNQEVDRVSISEENSPDQSTLGGIEKDSEMFPSSADTKVEEDCTPTGSRKQEAFYQDSLSSQTMTSVSVNENSGTLNPQSGQMMQQNGRNPSDELDFIPVTNHGDPVDDLDCLTIFADGEPTLVIPEQILTDYNDNQTREVTNEEVVEDWRDASNDSQNEKTNIDNSTHEYPRWQYDQAYTRNENLAAEYTQNIGYPTTHQPLLYSQFPMHHPNISKETAQQQLMELFDISQKIAITLGGFCHASTQAQYSELDQNQQHYYQYQQQHHQLENPASSNYSNISGSDEDGKSIELPPSNSNITDASQAMNRVIADPYFASTLSCNQQNVQSCDEHAIPAADEHVLGSSEMLKSLEETAIGQDRETDSRLIQKTATTQLNVSYQREEAPKTKRDMSPEGADFSGQATGFRDNVHEDRVSASSRTPQCPKKLYHTEMRDVELVCQTESISAREEQLQSCDLPHSKQNVSEEHKIRGTIDEINDGVNKEDDGRNRKRLPNTNTAVITDSNGVLNNLGNAPTAALPSPSVHVSSPSKLATSGLVRPTATQAPAMPALPVTAAVTSSSGPPAPELHAAPAPSTPPPPAPSVPASRAVLSSAAASQAGLAPSMQPPAASSVSESPVVLASALGASASSASAQPTSQDNEGEPEHSSSVDAATYLRELDLGLKAVARKNLEKRLRGNFRGNKFEVLCIDIKLTRGYPSRVDNYDLLFNFSDFMDPDSGIFTAPVRGKYRFEVAFDQLRHGKGRVYLVRDDGNHHVIGRLLEHKDQHNTIVEWTCDQGANVWVEAVRMTGAVKLKWLRFRGEFMG